MKILAIYLLSILALSSCRPGVDNLENQSMVPNSALLDARDDQPECRYYLNWPHFYWGTQYVNSTIEGAVWNQNQGEPAVCGNRNVTSCTANGYTYWRGQYFGDGRGRYEVCRKKIEVNPSVGCTPMPGKPFCLIDETLLSDGIHHQATHNAQGQKALQNQYGIFVSYASTVYADPDENTTSNFIFARSQDGGKTFQNFFSSSMHRTLPPAIVSDLDGNIFSIHGTGTEWTGPNGTPLWPKDAWFYRFDAGQGFANPTISKIGKGSTDKYDFIFDSKTGNFFYMTFNDTLYDTNMIPSFFAIRPDGDVEYSMGMSRMVNLDSKFPKIMYPHLATDGNRIIAAWSTEYDPPGSSDPDDPNQTNLYRNVSFVYSDDIGHSWRNLTGEKVKTPMVMDESGPSTTVTQPDEIGDHNWLGGIAYTNNRLYVSYQVWGKAHPGSHPHFSAYDLNQRTRALDMREWRGSKLTSDGTGRFIVNPQNPSGPVYLAAGGTYEGKGVVVILISEDQGNSWREYAVGSYHDGDPSVVLNVSPSATITPDGHIVGVFTKCNPRPEIGRCESYMHGQYILDSRAYFFRVKAK